VPPPAPFGGGGGFDLAPPSEAPGGGVKAFFRNSRSPGVAFFHLFFKTLAFLFWHATTAMFIFLNKKGPPLMRVSPFFLLRHREASPFF
jgi:hypothetical protein